jgi:hypothetical protein
MFRGMKRWCRERFGLGSTSGAAAATDVRQLRFENYDDYVAAQCKTNLVKRERVWVHDRELETLASAIRSVVPQPRFGLCHGVRNGAEVRRLRELLGCEVWGTEISPSASDYDYVIQWDFHQVRPEWLGTCDFVYSNSLDHSYDPAACLTAWLSCLSPQGRCFLHWSNEHDHTDFGKNGSDCFQATRAGYRQLIDQVGVFQQQIETESEDQRCLMVCSRGSQLAKAA